MTANHNRHDLLIVSTHGHIYCLQKKTGSRIWRQDFPSKYTGGLISLFINDADQLIVAAQGKTCAMDLFTGTHRWTNDMEGMGYHEISVVSTPTVNHGLSYAPPANEKSGWGDDSNERPPDYASSEKAVVIACSYGKVAGIDSKSGQTLWKFDCPSGGYNLPVVIAETDMIFIGCGRMVYALNPKDGSTFWSTKATNGLVGSGWMTMATVWGSRQAEV
ncbi:hypothetical protein INT44_007583 [Umbelopsis vinacea]|uniref:Pyrrolo-quinoline quinone repeat domain-containing protein n=1 Tax=Umbelopsis vinacea TaxID=44442 RepID=A0A8H7PJY2_9FUNG|nr:hypothetical protein INT44_007583 [Umbelopsis vinacea]KAI9287977.1 hypothetical protein BC943DRAFT_273934 [Umbelopsis sp. AD052]